MRLDSCEFEDYRPAIALGYWAASKRRVFDDGPWNESLWWFGGPDAAAMPIEGLTRVDVAARRGGYFTLRGRETWGMVRCCTYDDRPAQADMLNVDVWWRGANVIADPGTFSYNGDAPWNNGLSRTRVHNTVEVDDLDQMERGPRFTWFGWTRSREIRCTIAGDHRIFEGEHYGYSRRLGIEHRRAVILLGHRTWVVVDDLAGAGEHILSSQWLVPHGTILERSDSTFRLGTPAGDCAMTFVSSLPGGGSQFRGVTVVDPTADDTLGWLSTRYQDREPALGLLVRDRQDLPARLVTVLSLGVSCTIGFTPASAMTVRAGEECWRIELRPFPYDRDESLVQSVQTMLVDAS